MISEPIWLDHFFALAVFVIFPIYAALTIKKVFDDVRRRGEPARITVYWQIIATWVFFSLCVIVFWFEIERPWHELGIQLGDPGTNLVGLVIAAAIVAMVVLPIRSLSLKAVAAAEMDAQLGDLALIMPESRREERWFKAVSVNAGITEELIFRGYLIWYLQHYVDTWVAAVAAVLLFGLAHLYQGVKNLPGILFISASAVGLYIYTESLLVPIVFHIAVDALQGHYIARIRRASVAESTESKEGQG